jgi:hypothetical protein
MTRDSLLAFPTLNLNIKTDYKINKVFFLQLSSLKLNRSFSMVFAILHFDSVLNPSHTKGIKH